MDCSFKGTDGQVYRVSAMTLKDREDLRLYVQYREYHNFALAKHTIAPEDYRSQSSELLNHCARKSTKQIALEEKDYMDSEDSIPYILWLHLRRMHPELKPGDIGPLVSLDNFHEAIDAMNIANGGVKDQSEADDDKKKAMSPTNSI